MDARESHVFSHLFDLSLLRFPLLRRIKGNGKKIVDSYRRYNFLERRTVRHARKKKKKRKNLEKKSKSRTIGRKFQKEEEEINDDSRSTTSFFNFQNNFESTIHPSTANRQTPLQQKLTERSHQKNPLQVFT